MRTKAYKVMATVEYDGTEFHGFQIQPRWRTVQGELERALESVTGESIRIVGAGRTDAGVHALGQVISFTSGWRHSLGALKRALNATLPADVAVGHIEGVGVEFDARRSARSREYRYTILNRTIRSPLQRRRCYHHRHPLDAALMQQEAKLLVGEHDFAAFGRSPRGGTTVRRVMALDSHREGDTIQVVVEANSFLKRMVRTIVGGLVAIGEGSLPPGVLWEVLQSGERGRVKRVAPPQGLCLLAVKY
jgi:tRNA pseudouridine38-40 synthase